MTDGLFTLLLYCVLMAIASFGAGMLPLAVSLSQSQLRLLSTIGMGVLVGTSLIVIIPEGIETIYTVPVTAVAAVPPVVNARSWELSSALRIRREEIYLWSRDSDDQHEQPELNPPVAPRPPPPPAPPPPPQAQPDEDDLEEDAHEHEESHATPHKWVGLSLISGFILMYLIDVLPSHTHNPEPIPYHVSVDNLRSMSTSPSHDSSTSRNSGAKPFSMTLGLVIHAAADGIALGASSTSSNLALGAIVFLAIMLHKAPAAFGLTAVLMRSGLVKRTVRTHLLVFSLAAPAGALGTWLLIGLLGGGGAAGAAGMHWWTGVLLLFSGGTFLYVAMHTMQEQAQQLQEVGHKSTLKDVGAAVFGMVLPLVTQIGHHH